MMFLDQSLLLESQSSQSKVSKERASKKVIKYDYISFEPDLPTGFSSGFAITGFHHFRVNLIEILVILKSSFN